MMTMTLVRLQDPPVIEVHTRVQRWTLAGGSAVRWLTSLPEPVQGDPSTGSPAPGWRTGTDPEVLAVLDDLGLDAWVNSTNTQLPARELADRLGADYELAPWAAERWDAGMCADWCLIEPATWRSYATRGLTPEPLPERNPYSGRIEWDALEIRLWHEQGRAGQGARTDLAADKR